MFLRPCKEMYTAVRHDQSYLRSWSGISCSVSDMLRSRQGCGQVMGLTTSVLII